MHGVIWKERNLRIFENKARSSKEVLEAVIREVGSGIVAVLDFRGLPLSLVISDWFSSLAWSRPSRGSVVKDWIPPPVGIFKRNFDGASRGNSSVAGFGCVIRDHALLIVKSCSGLLGICGTIEAKARAVLMGLRELKD